MARRNGPGPDVDVVYQRGKYEPQTDVWDEPLCLIENTDRGLDVNELTLDKISKVKLPISVVTIVGQYRTGKSYLQNELAGRQKGFRLGSTIQAETKGIWAWLRPHPNKKDERLLLLDTEGLGDVENGDQHHDNLIFVLAVLLSGTLIYNSMKTINNDALESLHFITKMADHMKIKVGTSKPNGTEFGAFFPSFIWAIRDSTLDLELDGRSITSDEYLENSLMLKSGIDSKTANFNLVRRCIKKFFPSRKCFTFPMPVKDQNRLKYLEKLDRSQLQPDFLNSVDQLVKHIYQNLQPNKIQGMTVTGSVFCSLAKSYVDAMRLGAVPCIQNALEACAKQENKKLFISTLDLYRSMVLEEVGKLPTEFDYTLSKAHHNCKPIAMAKFNTAVMLDIDMKFSDLMEVKIDEKFKMLSKKNDDASAKECEAILLKLYQPISKQVLAGKFDRLGGYEEYREKMKKLEESYLYDPNQSFKYKEVLREFKKITEKEHSRIRSLDWRLRDQQDKAKDLERLVELRKRRQMRAEKEKRHREAEQAEQQKKQEEAMKRMLEEHRREIERQKQERQEQVEQLFEELAERRRQALLRQREVMHRALEEQIARIHQQRSKDDDDCVIS